MASDDGFDPMVEQERLAVCDGGKPLLSRVLGALAHRRRRYVLYYLREHQEAQIGDLAARLAAWERDVPVDDVSAEEVERFEGDLVHSDLPRLEDYGFVEYDRRTGTVSYAHPPPLLEEALELAATVEDPS